MSSLNAGMKVMRVEMETSRFHTASTHYLITSLSSSSSLVQISAQGPSRYGTVLRFHGFTNSPEATSLGASSRATRAEG